MAEPFDPYWKWLGIPPKHQPPNAYRLLGIELFEYDPDVIDNAADQRMGHLKNFGAGEYAELSERILNEIASARIRLLNPERKAEYDAQLRQRTGRQPMIPPNIPHDSEPRQEQPTDVGTVTARPDPIISIDVGDDNQTPTARRHGRNGRRPAWQVPVTIGGGACLVTVVLSILLFAGKNGVEDPGPTGLPQVAKPSGKGDTSGQQGVGAQPPTPDPDETTPDGSPTAGSESDDGPSDEEPPRDDPPAEVEPNGTAPAQRPEPTPDPPSPGSEADEQERQPSVVRPVPAFPRRSAVLMPPTPPPRVRLPEPGERARRAAEKEIRGVYEQKISEATTPRLKKALAHWGSSSRALL